MWCIEAKAKIDIPLGENISDWTNRQFKKFINEHKGRCDEFTKALDWLGDKDYKDAVRLCSNRTWLNWLRDKIPHDGQPIKSGSVITITKGKNEKYALWHGSGIWDLPEEYVGETVRIISESE